jgi:hypothetical protein
MEVTSFIQLYIHTHYPFNYTHTHILHSFDPILSCNSCQTCHSTIHLYIYTSHYLYIYLYIYTFCSTLYILFNSIHFVQLDTFIFKIRILKREREREMDRSYLPSAKAEQRSVIDNGGDIVHSTLLYTHIILLTTHTHILHSFNSTHIHATTFPTLQYIYTSIHLTIYTSIHLPLHLYILFNSIHSVQLYTFCSTLYIYFFKIRILKRDRERNGSKLPSECQG